MLRPVAGLVLRLLLAIGLVPVVLLTVTAGCPAGGVKADLRAEQRAEDADIGDLLKQSEKDKKRADPVGKKPGQAERRGLPTGGGQPADRPRREVVKYDGETDTWRVKMKNGSSVLLLADMHGETNTHHLFSILVDATKEEQESLHVEGTTPTNPERVLVSVAAFALEDVESVESGESWKEIPKSQ